MGQSAQLQRMEGITNVLKDYPDIKILAQNTANWSRSEDNGSNGNMDHYIWG